MTASDKPLTNTTISDGLIAVDIGNARIKLGWFPPHVSSGDLGQPLPVPASTLHLDGRQPSMDRLNGWIESLGSDRLRWAIGSVNRPATTRLLDFLGEFRRGDAARLLAACDLPVVAHVPQPDRVGVDRLLDAVAANALRRPDRPAVVVDVGTAITVDFIDHGGAFRGGAIIPGIAMSARALHEFTDLLPQLDMRELDNPPRPIGESTEQAIRSGLFWMAVGTVRELAQRMVADQSADTDIFVSGGAGMAVADLLGPEAKHVPHLTLGGICRSVGGDWDVGGETP